MAQGNEPQTEEAVPQVDREVAERWIGALHRCPRCGKRKPPAEFYARQDRPGRERPHCCDCHKAISLAWQRENRDLHNEANARYRDRNRDRDRERSRRRRAKLKREGEARA